MISAFNVRSAGAEFQFLRQEIACHEMKETVASPWNIPSSDTQQSLKSKMDGHFSCFYA
jgi:hypothetical protein